MGISSGKGPKVAVLMGGRSLEREVSLISGQACSAALRGEDFEGLEYFTINVGNSINTESINLSKLSKLKDPDYF